MRRLPDRGVLRRRRPALFALIGVLSVVAQPLRGQEPAQVGVLGPKDGRFRERFDALLLRDPPRDLLEQGWQLAADLGRPAVPLLWEMLREEKSNVQRRITLLVAVFAASGVGEDERLWRWLSDKTLLPIERAMACLLLALGPDRRALPGASFWSLAFGKGRETEDILKIAALLAAPRIPDAVKDAPPRRDEDDVGILAAAAYCRLPASPSLEAKLWNLRDPVRHAELYWRGTFLGRLRGEREPAEAVLLERARRIAELSDTYASARDAAALYRSRHGDVTPGGVRPHWETLQLLASEPATAVKLEKWLSPTPPTDEPRRLAVEYVLSRPVEEVVAQAPLWSADTRVRADVALALAWRLLDRDPAQVQPITAPVPAVPEWFFVRWASGAPGGHDAEIRGDPVLERAASLAAGGRLPRAVAREVLEEALWRRKSHPGLGLFHAQRALIRDLLLSGSHAGMRWRPHVPLEQRYQPAGFGPSHGFFEIAVLAFEFFSQPRPPIPNECRLR